MVEVHIYKEHETGNKPLYRMYIPNISTRKKLYPESVIGFTLKEDIIQTQFYSIDLSVVRKAQLIIKAGLKEEDISTIMGHPKYLGHADIRTAIVRHLVSSAQSFEEFRRETSVGLEIIVNFSKIEELRGKKVD